MSDNVTPIWQAAKDALYSVHVTHKAGGEVTVEIDGIGHDTRSRECAAQALETAAALCRNGSVRA